MGDGNWQRYVNRFKTDLFPAERPPRADSFECWLGSTVNDGLRQYQPVVGAENVARARRPREAVGPSLPPNWRSGSCVPHQPALLRRPQTSIPFHTPARRPFR